MTETSVTFLHTIMPPYPKDLARAPCSSWRPDKSGNSALFAKDNFDTAYHAQKTQSNHHAAMNTLEMPIEGTSRHTSTLESAVESTKSVDPYSCSVN
jgi:hypothetical protein